MYHFFNWTKISFEPGNRKPETMILMVGILCFMSLSSFSQSKKDTTLILISDISVQFEATEAMNNLYNFKFDKAEEQFKSFKEKYRWHPLPYFLVGLAEWWKIMPNMKETKYDEKFLAYMENYTITFRNIKSRPHFFWQPPMDLKASFMRTLKEKIG